eukprot:TRINITY_DN5112_c0_g1_i11.p1 TRINITY_DN5112_c0_g1~~TRINITY_DN5112_c0_g1_i11.p1  ORF type:complete len:791 (-),score=94.46 TRINITY_DN5112_c0_g1_i11:570-2942(-)
MSFRAQHQLQHPAPGELDYKVLEIDRAWSHVAASPPSQQALEEAEWQTVRGPRRSLPLPPDALVLDYKTRECRQHQCPSPRDCWFYHGQIDRRRIPTRSSDGRWSYCHHRGDGEDSAQNHPEMAYHPEKFRSKRCSKPTTSEGHCSGEFGARCAFIHDELPKFERSEELRLWGGSCWDIAEVVHQLGELRKRHPGGGLVLILRGVPGAGKSYLCEQLDPEDAPAVCSADAFFTNPKNGEYKFDGSKLSQAHDACFCQFEKRLKKRVGLVVLDNTNVERRHYSKYVEAALNSSYRVRIVELRHPRTPAAAQMLAARNRHRVPADAILKRLNSFEDDPRACVVHVPEPSAIGIANCVGSSSDLQAVQSHQGALGPPRWESFPERRPGGALTRTASSVERVEPGILLGPCVRAVNPLLKTEYALLDPFGAYNMDYQRRLLDHVATGLWHFVVGAMWDRCERHGGTFVQICVRDENHRFFHLRDVDQAISDLSNPISEPVQYVVGKGCPDAQNLLRIIKEQRLMQRYVHASSRGLTRSEFDRDDLKELRNQIAHGEYLRASSELRGKHAINSAMDKAISLLEELDGSAEYKLWRTGDAAFTEQGCLKSLRCLKASFGENQIMVERQRHLCATTTDDDILQMGVRTLENALVQIKEGRERKQWAQWIVRSIMCREREGQELDPRAWSEEIRAQSNLPPLNDSSQMSLPEISLTVGEDCPECDDDDDDPGEMIFTGLSDEEKITLECGACRRELLRGQFTNKEVRKPRRRCRDCASNTSGMPLVPCVATLQETALQ